MVRLFDIAFFNHHCSVTGGGGYDSFTSYRCRIIHRPEENMINVKVWEEGTLIIDTEDIFDNTEDSLKGGRLGVYCDSQEDIIWSALSYRCL